MDKNKVVLLIPALNPDEKLVNLVKELKKEEFTKIFIVNDGSNKDFLHIFEEVKSLGCKVFQHHKNYGKGRALKNAFNQLYTEFPDFEVVVTLDADGQHRVKDVISVAEKTMQEKDCLVLGSREFGKDVPFRSKFGNILTRNIMKVLCGIKVRDTQTGLRGFSKELLENFLDIPGERYEYELNVLLATKEKDIKIVECPIETVYIDDNKSSHFNPIKDSIRIYSLFIKYIISALLSFVVDISLFAIFVHIFKGITYVGYIFIATILARIISSFVNYLVNKNTVFKNKQTSRKAFIKSLIGYYLLVVANMIVSSLCVNFISKALSFNEITVKFVVDMILFVCNYVIQREIIFKNKRNSK